MPALSCSRRKRSERACSRFCNPHNQNMRGRQRHEGQLTAATLLRSYGDVRSRCSVAMSGFRRVFCRRAMRRVRLIDVGSEASAPADIEFRTMFV